MLVKFHPLNFAKFLSTGRPMKVCIVGDPKGGSDSSVIAVWFHSTDCTCRMFRELIFS
jgi:hypothetical protein